RDSRGQPVIRSLLFPAREATLLDTWNTIGLRGTASDSYRLDDVFVAERFSGTRLEPALRRERGPLYAFTMQGLYAVGVAGVALDTADFTYKGAGVDAIFPGSPFERRFRDIHTVSQQIQARTAHFEAVGRILLGTIPEVFF